MYSHAPIYFFEKRGSQRSGALVKIQFLAKLVENICEQKTGERLSKRLDARELRLV
jgi:hypothetical protein